jgi:cell division protein FtsI/penicillin-binding protein 2
MRTTAFIVAVLLVVSIFIADLFRIQIIDRNEYQAQAISLSSASSEIDALRGEILDSNGQALVYNVRSNSVYIDASYFPSSSKKAERVRRVIRFCSNCIQIYDR